MIRDPEKIDLRYLRSLDSKITHAWVARFFSIYLTYEWFIFSTDSDAYNRYAFRTVVTMVPKVFLLYVIGLWLSTTQWGLRHKKILYVLLLPSLLMSPSIAGFPSSIMGWSSFFVVVWTYKVIYQTEGEVQ
ncbi:MAG: hypothetical protein NTX25_04065 [Proteobacteria bacterium]|nr:hypothetical protein [Pseudomonadota bacterium]